MTTPLLDNQNNEQNQNQTQESDQTQTTTQTQDNSTQAPSQSQPAQPTSEVGGLYKEAYNEQYRINQAKEARIAELETRLAAGGPGGKQIDDTNFFQEPATNVRTLIREELNAALGTLPQELRTNARMSQYQNLKNQFRTHPHYPDFSEHEAGIDMIMNNSGVEPTTQGIDNAIKYLRGVKVSEQYKTGAPANNNNNNNNNNNSNDRQVPAYTAPSAPPAPRNQNNDMQSKINALTEAERRVATARRMTFEQFILERDNPNTSLLSDPNPPKK